MGQRLTPEQRERILTMLEDGCRVDDICEELGVKPSQVYSQKKKLAAPTESPDDSEVEEDEVVDEDFWKMKYLMAHALLVEHKIVE